MNKFGLIGNPISESLSPSLFKEAYNGEYIYDLIEGEDFEKVWEIFRTENYKSINITAPFKELAYRKIANEVINSEASISGPCFKIKATNLVIKNNSAIEAHNTDFSAVILCIAETLFPGIVTEFYNLYKEQLHIKIHQFCKKQINSTYGYKPQALIVGCGGAGKAAAVAAAEIGFDVAIMNRTIDKVNEFCKEAPEYQFIADPLSDFIPAVKECDLIIYTLPVKIDDIYKLEISDFLGENPQIENRPRKIILEANYIHPSFTPDIIIKMMTAGCNYVSGIQWLLYQSLTGYSLMTNKLPNLRAMQEKGF